MQECAVIFPHQLHYNILDFNKIKTVYLVENKLYFTQYNFHKVKLVFHRASMQKFKNHLEIKGFEVRYIEFHEKEASVKGLFKEIQNEFQSVQYIKTDDDWLEKQIISSSNEYNLHLHPLKNPNFLNSTDQFNSYFDGRKRYFQTDFYSHQRKQRNILMEDGKPLGGKLTFDSENRKPYPKNHIPPKPNLNFRDNYVVEAENYIEKNFSSNIGSLEYFKFSNEFYPTDPNQSIAAWEDFKLNRFKLFGDFEDAFTQNSDDLFTYHSILTPQLNVGLVSPETLINDAHLSDVPINSKEGFIRQIMGWREFMRAVYIREGGNQRGSNFWGFKRAIPDSFYNGTTGIKPVDLVIKKVLKTGYCHHIERLMILGNFFLLCEFHPNEVYRWFMELFIDAYDWVMVPNIYGMSQFADGGLITTKPYISGSNYIIKMSDYKKQNDEWEQIWDALYWRFINLHRDFFQQNPRLGMMVITYDKMKDEKKEQMKKLANSFLQRLS